MNNKIEINCVVIELKPNSLNRVRQWASFIQENEVEALQSLENEGVTVENFFLITLGKKDYLIAYMRAKSMAIASKVVKKSLLKIDAYHQKFKTDTWKNGSKAELLVDLSRIPNESKILPKSRYRNALDSASN